MCLSRPGAVMTARWRRADETKSLCVMSAAAAGRLFSCPSLSFTAPQGRAPEVVQHGGLTAARERTEVDGQS